MSMTSLFTDCYSAEGEMVSGLKVWVYWVPGEGNRLALVLWMVVECVCVCGVGAVKGRESSIQYTGGFSPGISKTKYVLPLWLIFIWNSHFYLNKKIFLFM